MPQPLPPLRERLRSGGRILVIGHRGAMGSRPENTLASFQHAVALGADMVELDVQLSRDRQPVVIHDESLERTTSGRGYVRDRTLAELQALDAGNWFDVEFAGQRVPSFVEVVAWAREHGVALDVDLKPGMGLNEGIEVAVLATLRRYGMLQRAMLVSFDHPTVARVKQLEPTVVTGVIYVGRPCEPIALARAAQADVLLPRWDHVEASDVDAAHAAGVAVAPRFTSDLVDMQRLIAVGVDALATNDPDLLRPLVDARRSVPGAVAA